MADESNDDERNVERVDMTPDPAFTPDEEWAAKAEFVVTVDPDEASRNGLSNTLEEDTLVENAVVDRKDDEQGDLREKAHELRRHELVNHLDIEFHAERGEEPLKVTVEGQYPVETGMMASLLLSAHVRAVIEEQDYVSTVEVGQHHAVERRPRTIEETMSVDFGTKVYEENEDGETVVTDNREGVDA